MNFQLQCPCGHQLRRKVEFNAYPEAEELYPGPFGDFAGRLATLGDLICPECDKEMVSVKKTEDGGVRVFILCAVIGTNQ